VARLGAEADDVNAAVDFVLRTKSKIDAKHVINMGYSFGGIVTTLASAKNGSRYAAVMLQAPGALNWLRSSHLRAALIAAAAKIRTPIMCVVAENDATTESAQKICGAAQAAGASATVKIYPPYNSGQERPGNPPGHALFSPAGLSIWRDDALAFLKSATR
jgi:dienelactone hydrolase